MYFSCSSSNVFSNKPESSNIHEDNSPLNDSKNVFSDTSGILETKRVLDVDKESVIST